MDGSARRPGQRSGRRQAKARVLGLRVLDIGIDVVVPLLVYGLLNALSVPTYLALASGGVLVGAKAALGPVMR